MDAAEKTKPLAHDIAIRAIVLGHIVSYARALNDLSGSHRPLSITAQDRLAQSLYQYQEAITPDEQVFISWPPEELELGHIQAVCNQIEAIQTLLWALGMLSELPSYDAEASFSLPSALALLSLPACLPNVALRPWDEIAKARAIAELWHWRSRTRYLIEAGAMPPSQPGLLRMGLTTYDAIVRWTVEQSLADQLISQSADGDFPACGAAYRDLPPREWSRVRMIAIQRHFALNWVCGYSVMNRWDDTPTET